MAQKLSQKVAQKLSQKHYSRLPEDVLCDFRLTSAAKCVYAFLAGCVHQGTVARVGQRRIAERVCVSRSTVDAAIAALAECGHLKVLVSGKQRGMYHLTSQIFGTKQRALNAGETSVEELVSGPRRRLATVRKTA